MANPAMTLHHHLQAVISHKQGNWLQAWQEVLGIPLEQAAGPLLSLIDESRRIVSARPKIDMQSVFLREPEWRRTILLHNVNLGAAIKDSGFRLSADALAGLYNVGAMIDLMPETRPGVAEEHVEQLAEALRNLRAAVLDATDVGPDLRLFLLDQINLMQTRIDRVKITGTGPIEDLVAETIGSSAVNASFWDRAMKSSMKTKIVAVFIALHAIPGVINAAATDINSTKQAIDTVSTVVERILGEGPKQIEAPRVQPALPSAHDTN